MNKNTLLKGALAVATAMLPISQAIADDAGGTNWSLSGWINQGVTYADDGSNSDIISAADNGTTLGSRMTFAGSTDLPAGLNAGFEVILEPRTDGDGLLGVGTIGATSGSPDSFSNVNGDTINVLGHSVFLGGAWGKFTFGLQSMPTDNIAVLEDPSLTLWSSISPVFRGNNIALQNNGVAVGGGISPGSFLQCFAVPGLNIGIDCNGIYRQGVRYDLPTFIENLGLAVSWANDDVYDVAAKYKGQLGRLKGQIALGYSVNSGTNAANFNNADTFQLQAGLMDPVTGLFGSIAYQNESADLIAAADAAGETDDTDAYWLKVGIKKAFNTLGDTSLAFAYGSYNDQYAQGLGALGVTGSEMERIGFEVNQYLGSRLIVYGTYENLSSDVDGAGATVTAINSAEDVDVFTLGFTFFY